MPTALRVTPARVPKRVTPAWRVCFRLSSDRKALLLRLANQRLEPELHQARQIACRDPMTGERARLLQQFAEFAVSCEVHAVPVIRQWIQR
jgi:hypothetical protein